MSSKHTPFMQGILETCASQSGDNVYPEVTVPYDVLSGLEEKVKELNALLTEIRDKSDFMAQDGVGLTASKFAHEMTRNKIDHYRGVSNDK